MNSLKILADKHDIVLCFDEVQCGIGRTGQFFCWQNFGVKPDIITLAKALSGGIFPVATTLMNEKIAHAITHNQTQKFNNGSTFGGNPLAATAVLTTIELLLEKDNPFLSEISAHNAAYLHEQLIFLEKKYSHIITEIRGIGFMKGIQLSNQLNNITIVNQLRQSGLFTMPAGDNVIRLVPPLNISKHHIDEAINLFQKVFSEM
jgi:acetylornithine/N-succinyldiaminopimelate aminotransferase